MSRTLIDLHVLQTVPPSNINRDESGSPKTAVYGGVRRARVSSQAWKRATRVAFNEQLDPADVGVRTKRVVSLLMEEINNATTDTDVAQRAEELAVETIKAVGIELKTPNKDKKNPEKQKQKEAGYLVFLSRRQLQSLAEAAVAAAGTGDVSKALKDAKVKDLVDRDHSVDVALFGRMVADQADLNVDAAVQVAHAISVHPVETEFDYFTAVEEVRDDHESGAGMIDTVEFNSATLYRYATIDVGGLADNLGSTEAARRAVEVFVESFVRSMPTGKQNTFANRTLPEAVVAMARDSQPINLVGAFENPVRETLTTGRTKRASDALRDEAQEVARVYDEQPFAAWVSRVGTDTAGLDELGTNVPLRTLVTQVGELVTSRVEER